MRMKNRAVVVLEEGGCPFMDDLSFSCCFASFGVFI